MEAKELRIGNWIQYPQTADIARAGYYFGQVSEISEKHNTINIKNYILATDFKLSECKPILLNEEWLLKLGFSKMTIKPLWRKTIGEYTLDSEDFLFDFKSKHIYADSGLTLHPIGNEIKYVHQLQNAFFALTGQELTLTPAKEMK